MCSSARSVKFIDGDDLDLLVSLAVKLAVALVINFHGNFRLALDDVKIRDEIAVGVDEKSGAKPLRRADLHDGLAYLLDEVGHVARGRGHGVDGVNCGAMALKQRSGGGGLRRRRLVRLGNFGDGVARDDQHGVADIHDDGVGFLGEDFAGDGGLVLELDRIGGRERYPGSHQRRQDEMIF